MIKTAKVAFDMVFQIFRDMQIMTRYDKIVIKSGISETILNKLRTYSKVKMTQHNAGKA
jgi:hypothetical protein